MHWRAGGEAAEARGVRRPPAVDAGRVPVGRRACVSRAMRTAYSMYPAECHACVCAVVKLRSTAQVLRVTGWLGCMPLVSVCSHHTHGESRPRRRTSPRRIIIGNAQVQRSRMGVPMRASSDHGARLPVAPQARGLAAR